MADITPRGRLLFWLRASFVADGVLGVIAGLLIAEGESVGYALLLFVVLRAGIGVIALVIALRALEDRRPNDDRPSVIR